VFSDPSIPRLLGKRARRRAFERFTWQGIARLLADLYAEVAAAPLARPAVAQGN
jgi:glycosyltransferase involved in cell wall biosynthesis